MSIADNVVRALKSAGAYENSTWTDRIINTLADQVQAAYEAARLGDSAVDVRDFGAKLNYNPANGSGNDDAAAWNAAFAKSPIVKAPPGLSKISSMVDIPPHGAILCDVGSAGYFGGSGVDWNPAAMITLVPRSMAKTHTINAMITSCETTGGVIANPAAAEPYATSSQGRLAFYSLKDFTNQNAVGATRATPKPLSVAVRLRRFGRMYGVNVRTSMLDGRLVSSGADTNFGDPCDIGVLAENAYSAEITNCNISWGFRMYGLLHAQYDAGDGYFPQGDHFVARGNYLEGHCTIGIRNYDSVKVVAVDQPGGTVRCPWFKSHRFPTSGSLSISGTQYAYTTLTHDSGTNELVFGGMTLPGSGGPVVNQPMAIYEDAQNFGVGGTTFDKNYIRSITHRSFYQSTDGYFTDRFDACGNMIEISGTVCRGINFTGANIYHGREDVACFINDGSDIDFYGYAEAKSITGTSPVCRFIGLSADAKIAKGITTAPSGCQAGYIRFIGWSQTEAQIDRSPTYRTVLSMGRFGTTEGLFCPSSPSADDYEQSNWSSQHPVRVIQGPGSYYTDHPIQLRTPPSASNTGVTAMSMDRNGVVMIGTSGADRTQDVNTGVNDRLVVTNSGGLRVRAKNTGSTTSTGFIAENTAGAAGITVESDGSLQLVQNNVGRMRATAASFYPTATGSMSLGTAALAFSTQYLTVGLRVNDVQVVGAQGLAVANATNATDVITQLNALLARLRAHGLIAT